MDVRLLPARSPRPDNTGPNRPFPALEDQRSGPNTAEAGGSSPPRATRYSESASPTEQGSNRPCSPDFLPGPPVASTTRPVRTALLAPAAVACSDLPTGPAGDLPEDEEQPAGTVTSSCRAPAWRLHLAPSQRSASVQAEHAGHLSAGPLPTTCPRLTVAPTTWRGPCRPWRGRGPR